MISIIILILLIAQLVLTIKLWRSADDKSGLTVYIVFIIILIAFSILNLINGNAFNNPEHPIISPRLPVT